mgnify:FL=1
MQATGGFERRRPIKGYMKKSFAPSGKVLNTPDAEREARFFELFDSFIDLERNTGRKYSDDEYSLRGIRFLAELSGHPEKQQRILHIAGTKGKGSTAIFLSSLLRSAGRHCGAFTSPHLLTVRERFLLDSRPVSYDLLFSEADKLLEDVKASDLNPTFFELMTILALRLFRRDSCDFTILETGIGGRRDCTNFVDHPECVIITSISRDHMALLGDSIREIAYQKAGIIKRGVPVVCAPQPFPEAFEVIQHTAACMDCPFTAVQDVAIDARDWGLANAPDFLKENFATALAACQTLDIEPDARKLELVWPPGRFEQISDSPLVVIDGAHNANSAARLREAVQVRWPDRKFTVVLGVAEGKDSLDILREMAAMGGEIILTNPRPPKKSDLERLVVCAEAEGIACQIIPEIRHHNDLPAERPLLFTGSFFTATIGRELFGC